MYMVSFDKISAWLFLIQVFLYAGFYCSSFYQKLCDASDELFVLF